MQSRLATATAAIAIAIAMSSVSFAAGEPSFGQDLMATIVLHGMPCDKVVESKRNADSDYSVTCKDGNRYHVYVNAQGRVIVDKR